MARTARKFLVRRSKDNLSIVFARRAGRLGTHGLGTLQCVRENPASGRLSIKNIEESEARGEDFYEIRGIPSRFWYTRNWNRDQELIEVDIRIQNLRGSTPPTDYVLEQLNFILGYTVERTDGDDQGSVLSVTGGTSVVGYSLQNVNYCIENGTEAGETGFLTDESGNKFVSEELNSVIQQSDGTFLSVDTRSVSHGGGGSAGNPVVSGAVSTDTLTLTLDDASTVDVDVSALRNNITSGAISGTNLVLTREDASTVTIDASLMVNNGVTTTIGLPNWYQTYASPGTGSSTAGDQIDTQIPPSTANPYYFGVTLKRGREFVFDHSTNNVGIFYGIWGGSTTYSPISSGNGVYWTKMFRALTGEITHGSNVFDSKGFDLTDDYTIVHNTTKLVLQYEYASNKLKLIDVTNDSWNTIATASVAEDGNPVIISCAVANLGAVPDFTDREHTWNIIAQLTANVDTSWHDGLLTGTVIKHNVGLHPGEKMVCSSPNSWGNHYMGWDYTGTSIGQTTPYNDNTSNLQFSGSEKIIAKDGFTINTKATRFDTGDTTISMDNAKVSWRYHLDNSMDLFDEDNEDILFTKDADLDGNPAFLHIYASTNITLDDMLHAWIFEPFADAWYHNPNNYTSVKKPNTRYIGTSGPGSQVQWGEKMYPGQEFVFQENQGGSGNTYIGIRNLDNSNYIKYFQLDGTYVTTSTGGFDITTQYGVQNKWMALRYDYGDHKLKLYDINTTGVETLITTATNAEDGNAIRISVSGNNNIPGASTLLRYYGWEYVHTNANHPQPWGNWRLNRPSVNTQLKVDTVLKHRQGLIPGNYMRWTPPNSGNSAFFGQWKSSNNTTGHSNPDQNYNHWDWGWRMNNSEQVFNLKGFTFNTSNEDYDAAGNIGAGVWDDPDKGVTQIQLRYHAGTNKIDLHDHTNNRVIATKDVDGDGNAIYLSWGSGTNISNISDDFFSGGDVEVAAATFAPSFTGATNMNYGNDGILNAGEMVKIDTTVPVGKRLIIHPEFWGQLEDMGGVTGSGPAATGTGWIENDVVIMGWQKASSPYVGTNIGNSNSGWDAAMYCLLRGPGTNHTSRIGLYSPANTTYTSRDGRIGTGNYTDLYFTFDRIATNSGRLMTFITLPAARVGVTGDNTQWYANSTDDYMNGNAQALTLTSDFYIYVYSNTGNFTLPTVACHEVVTIPT